MYALSWKSPFITIFCIPEVQQKWVIPTFNQENEVYMGKFYSKKGVKN